MTTGHVFIAVSLDGFIARPDGSLDWLSGSGQGPPPPPGEDFGYGAFIAGMDGIVMGRHTFETAVAFGAWPYEIPAVVLSRTLRATDIPPELRDQVRMMAGEPVEILDALSACGWRRAYIDGGDAVRGFLRANCISEMTLSRLPVVIGAGRPLFGPTDGDIWLDHVETRSFPGGLVQSRYLLSQQVTDIRHIRQRRCP